MSYRRAKRPRSLGGDPKLTYIVYPADVARERCLQDPEIYKSPAGNMIWMEDSRGKSDWMRPEEAEAFATEIAEIDARFPDGMPIPESIEEHIRAIHARALFAHYDDEGAA